MAGDWIKFEIATPDKPEVWEIAESLNIDPDAVIGKLIRLWIWFNTQTQNGHAPSVTKKLLDRDVGVMGFCDVVVRCGWMSEHDNKISLPNFERHNGSTAKTRALGQKRKQKERDLSRASVTPQQVPEKSNREENTTTKEQRDNNKRELEKHFDSFWSDYPGKKGSRSYALDSYKRKIKTPEQASQLVSNVQNRNALGLEQGWGQRDEQYIPHASTFINRGMWQDDVEVSGSDERDLMGL